MGLAFSVEMTSRTSTPSLRSRGSNSRNGIAPYKRDLRLLLKSFPLLQVELLWYLAGNTEKNSCQGLYAFLTSAGYNIWFDFWCFLASLLLFHTDAYTLAEAHTIIPLLSSSFSEETESGVWDQVPVLGGAAKSTSAATWQPERGALRQAQHGQSGGRMQVASVWPWCWGWRCSWPLQVSHLQELVREKEQNLGSAQTQITCLRETQEKLKIELDATRSRVRETSNLLTDLQVRIRLTFLFDVVCVWILNKTDILFRTKS